MTQSTPSQLVTITPHAHRRNKTAISYTHLPLPQTVWKLNEPPRQLWFQGVIASPDPHFFFSFFCVWQIHDTNPCPPCCTLWVNLTTQPSYIFITIQSACAHHLEKSSPWWRKLSKLLLAYAELSPAYKVGSPALLSLSLPPCLSPPSPSVFIFATDAA